MTDVREIHPNSHNIQQQLLQIQMDYERKISSPP